MSTFAPQVRLENYYTTYSSRLHESFETFIIPSAKNKKKRKEKTANEEKCTVSAEGMTSRNLKIKMLSKLYIREYTSKRKPI